MKHKIAHLKKQDKILGEIISRIKIAPLEKRTNHFRSLVRAILGQQISVKAAESITKKFIALFPRKRFPLPEDILKTKESLLRTAGISRSKIMYIKDLAQKALNGEVKLNKLGHLSDGEIVTELVKVKGIGQWTAEMFLMFSLGREDVFSYGDLGIRNAMKKIYGLRTHPTPKKAKDISDKWRPYRTLGCLYLWRALDN